MKSRLEELYKNQIRPEMKKELNFSNVMQVPCISKIVLNIGAKDAVSDGKVIAAIKGVLEKIAGQAVVTTQAKKIHRGI